MKLFCGLIFALLLLSSCATYYQRNAEFQDAFSKGELQRAQEMLEGNKKGKKKRNRLLYLFNMGVVLHLQKEYAQSNIYLNEADLLIEDFNKNYAQEALALVSNPEVKPYQVEDFEVVMVYYYKALNFLMLQNHESALVEVRRMNLALNQLNDKYKDHKNRYQNDAFANVMMGLIYESAGDLNDAFIAYRNAYSIYASQFGYFGIPVPAQLKQDLMRTAYLLGFREELKQYETEFSTIYKHQPIEQGEAVILWHNGLGPVKHEVSFNFIAVPGQVGYINFTNEDLGITFPFYIGDDQQKKNDLLALRVIRVAFPKYLERSLYYTKAELKSRDETYSFEKMEDINSIAFKTLEDRFLREMGASLLRLALKKAAELKLQEQNETIGALATITNAMSEKADTRNWQTIPHDISYVRVPLREGKNELILEMETVNGSTDRVAFEFFGKKGSLYFMPHHSLRHLPANMVR